MFARNTSEHSSRQLSGCSESKRWQPGAFKKTPEVSGPLTQERMDLFKVLISTLSSWSSVLFLLLFLGYGSKVPWSPLEEVSRRNCKVVGHFRNQMGPCEDLPPGLPRAGSNSGTGQRPACVVPLLFPLWWNRLQNGLFLVCGCWRSTSVQETSREGLKIIGFSDILEVSVSEIGVVGRPLHRYQKGEPRSTTLSALSHNSNSNCPPEAKTHPLEAGTNGEAMRKKQTWQYPSATLITSSV